MRWWSRLLGRRSRGRHALGAAVTAIPATPGPEPRPRTPDTPRTSDTPRTPGVPDSPRAARVSLGFRDGTTACLDPDSQQAAALEELALLLSRRD